VDFVVVGLGVGALAILLGLTIREVGSRWWSIQPDAPLSSPEQARRLAIGRAGRSGGTVLSLAGTFILIATIAAIALNLPDRTGAIVVMAVVTIAVLGTVVWGAVYARRSHPRSAHRTRRPRPAAEPLPVQRPSLAGTIDAAFAGDPPVAGSEADHRQDDGNLDPPPSGPFAPATEPEPAIATGSAATPGSDDPPNATGAPDARAEAPPEATPDETPSSTAAGDPAPDRRAPNAIPTGPDQAATSGAPPGSASHAAAPNASPSDERARIPPPGDGKPMAMAPGFIPASDSPDDIQETNGALADAPGKPGAGTERPALAGGAPRQPLVEAAPPRPGQADPARKDRPT
jgi:hypothetical protein